MADDDGPRAPHQHPLLAGDHGGRYANFANVCHSDYEFTITFARVDHEVEDEEIPGVVVSRVNLSPQFMRELIDAHGGQLLEVATREGIKNLPEFGGAQAAASPRNAAAPGQPLEATSGPATLHGRRSAALVAGGWRAGA